MTEHPSRAGKEEVVARLDPQATQFVAAATKIGWGLRVGRGARFQHPGFLLDAPAAMREGPLP